MVSSRFFSYEKENPDATIYLILARSSGQCLNFNCTFLVILMLRQCLTFLRSRGASIFLPIDQHIKFHKLTGIFTFVFGVFHTVMHLISIAEGVLPSTGSLEGCSILNNTRFTGCPLNSGNWTYLEFFLTQGQPVKALRCYNSKVGKGHTWVSSGILLPSKVTHVVIKRPSNFDFRPGDYVFVRIPKIAKYEWHPFTISSAPEQLDEIWLHVRACGQWTTKLYEYFEKGQLEVDFDLETIKIDSQRKEDSALTHVSISNELDLKKFPQKLQKPRSKLKASQSLSPYGDIKPDSSTEPRSISVYEQGNHKETENSRARRRTAKSFKYARNKPKVIALEVPLSNENEGVAMDGYNIEMDCQAEKTESQPESVGKSLEILLDEPYGALSNHIFRAEHAILIATGIGVTPFASILRSIMHRYLASQISCPGCNFKWCEELTQSTIMNLKKVDFFWINRDQQCFEWFV
ncbi:unnamed protein product [Orchesella dallaii]|uniref:FAD-binding FR-type domain-containing protein n=1 Tax=Orchesella dallaii TaxID=48710 RepID=A0ABP1RLT9_9HEXA